MNKYKLPWTHDAAQCQSYFELLIEYYEDLFEEDKTALYNEVADEDGHVILPETGDELIDKWERELAQGLTPDLEEGMTPQARQMATNEKKEALEKKLYGKALGGGFQDKYSSSNASVLGDDKNEVDDKVTTYAKSGGLKNLDPATLRRVVDSLSPNQAQEIIKIIKQG